ncbi:MAG: hypothetical protein ACRDRP_21385 [Pseudonocardiaceae bacterium]
MTLQGLGERGDVAGGDFAQVLVAGRPFDQHRMEGAQTAAHGAGVAGVAARPAVLQDADPGAHVGGDGGCQVSELVPQPGLEGGDAVVVEEPTAGEDLGDASDADPITVQHIDQLRVPQGLVIGMPGQQDDQRTVALGGQFGVPALGLAHHLGHLTHPDQGRVGRLSVRSPVEGSPGSG